ncbi:MAG: YihY/virulence factor BrkB family protein [Candidatus Ornithomonoglobus sp.]
MIKEFFLDMNDDNVGLYAAQSALFTMISAVPFLMLVILCLKYFINVDANAMAEAIRRTFPQPVSTYVCGIVSEIFMRSETVALLSATLATALWTSSRGIMAIYMGINNIYGYTRTTHWLAARITALLYDILFIAVIVASIICLVFGNTLLQLFRDYFNNYFVAHYALETVFRMKYLIFFVLFVFAFAGLYSFLPQKKMRFRSQLPGAAATAVGWIGFSFGFSVYITYFSKYSLLYGSLTAIIFMMLWIFFCIYMLLIGAEINKHIKNGYFRKMRCILTGKQYKNLKKRLKNP